MIPQSYVLGWLFNYLTGFANLSNRTRKMTQMEASCKEHLHSPGNLGIGGSSQYLLRVCTKEDLRISAKEK